MFGLIFVMEGEPPIALPANKKRMMGGVGAEGLRPPATRLGAG
ncbi:hypothetical protein [Pseudoalteromonas sp. ASV78]